MPSRWFSPESAVVPVSGTITPSLIGPPLAADAAGLTAAEVVAPDAGAGLAEAVPADELEVAGGAELDTGAAGAEAPPQADKSRTRIDPETHVNERVTVVSFHRRP